MKQKWIALALCAAMTLSLGACAPSVRTDPNAGADAPPASTSADNNTTDDEYAPFAGLFGLTAEQREEDFAYFEQTLRDSYPCWGLLERNGVDYDSILANYREMVSQSDNDFELFVAVNSALFRLGMEGHLSMLQPEWYTEFRETLTGLPEDYQRTHWRDALNTPASVENYPKLLEASIALEGDAGGSSEDFDAGGNTENVTTLIVDEGRIAYLRIASFDTSNFDEEHSQIQAFLDQVHNYEHLIVDITQNGGGSDEYWMAAIVAPLASHTLSSTNYALVRNSENTAPYLAEAFPADDLHPIDELPDLPRLEPRDRELATHFLENTLEVEPTGGGFAGKIWLLVDEYVYSSSEAFTVFCKDTGFATIVGSPTGGDGIGIDPVFLVLPNSGLIVRYSALFGLNPDGSSNEEFGTTPDLLSPAGEPPLVTALRAIRES